MFWIEMQLFDPDSTCIPESWLSCVRLRWITFAGQPKRWIPFAARSVGRALRNDSLSWIVEVVTPPRSMIPWSLLSDTTLESMRIAEPPTAWTPYLLAKLTTSCEMVTLVQELVS